MKTKFSISLIVTSLLLASTTVFANSNQNSISTKAAKAKVEETMSKEAFLAKVKSGDFKQEATQDETKRLHSVVNNIVQTHKDTLKKAPKEFMNALNDTIMALQSIKTGKADEAQKLLKTADKGFTKAFKQTPKLGLIPVVDNAEIISFNGSPKLIKHIKESAEKLLKENNTQVAIDLLMPLQDEIIIRTKYVPAYLYPIAVKKALKELKANKKDDAFATIVTALNALQTDTIIIPIPLLTAQNMVLEASKLEKSHKKEALNLLTMAQSELEKGVLLGYVTTKQKEYKNLDTKIKAIKSEIKGKNIVAKLYDNLLKDFKKLTHKNK